MRTSLFIMALRNLALGGKLLLTLYIAYALGLTELGLYGLITGLAGVCPTVLSFGFLNTLAREAVVQTEAQRAQALVGYWKAVICCYGIAILVIPFLPMEATLLGLVLAVVLTEHLNNDAFIYLNNLKRPVLGNMLFAIRTALWVPLFIGLTWYWPTTSTLSTLLGFWLGANLLALGVFIGVNRHWPWLKGLEFNHTWGWYVDIFKTSWRIWVAEGASMSTLFADRFIMALFMPLSTLGVYVLFWQIANALYTLTSMGLITVRRPDLIRLYKQNKMPEYQRVFRRCVQSSLGTYAAFAAVCMLVMPWVLKTMNQPIPTFAEPLLVLVLLGFFFRMGNFLMAQYFYTQSKDNVNLTFNLGTLIMVTLLVTLAAALTANPLNVALALAFAYALTTALRVGNLYWPAKTSR